MQLEFFDRAYIALRGKIPEKIIYKLHCKSKFNDMKFAMKKYVALLIRNRGIYFFL